MISSKFEIAQLTRRTKVKRGDEETYCIRTPRVPTSAWIMDGPSNGWHYAVLDVYWRCYTPRVVFFFFFSFLSRFLPIFASCETCSAA